MRNSRRIALAIMLASCWCGGTVRAEDRSPAAPAAGKAGPADGIAWMADYGEALNRGKLEQKMVLVYFRSKEGNQVQDDFETRSLADPTNKEKLAKFVPVRVDLDTKIKLDGKDVTLIEHEAFDELHGSPGLAIVDMANKGSDFYGYVVSSLPFNPGRYYRYRPEHLSVLLDLPKGTITQRTMFFAVRIHPESPASTVGELDPVLADEAASHSRYQADIRSQGHHRWGERFQRISARLPGGLLAQEVVAESWPDQGLVDACVDCVASWRQSPGHWGAVRARQPRFGYDIKRGPNGIWYATGIFGNRH